MAGYRLDRINEEIKIYYCEVERTKKLDLNKYLDLHYKKARKLFSAPFYKRALKVNSKHNSHLSAI